MAKKIIQFSGDSPRLHVDSRRISEEDRRKIGEEEAEATAEKSAAGEETQKALRTAQEAEWKENHEWHRPWQLQPEAVIHAEVCIIYIYIYIYNFFSKD